MMGKRTMQFSHVGAAAAAAIACAATLAGAAEPAGGMVEGPKRATTMAATRPVEVLAPSGVPVRRVIIEADAGEGEARQWAQLQLNSLGGEALPLLEAALADPGTGPERAVRLEQAIKFVRPRARRLQQEAERRAFFQSQLLAAYDNAPGRNPAWDEAARAAIQAWVELAPEPFLDKPGERKRVVALFEAAWAKGCATPLFVALWHFATGPISVGEQLRGGPPDPAGISMNRLVTGAYPTAVRLLGAARYLRLARQVEHETWRAWAVAMGELAATPGLPPEACDWVMTEFLDAAGNGDPLGGLVSLVDAYQKAAPARPGPLFARGKLLLDAAWAARARKWGAAIRPEQLKTFADRLGEAEEALAKAYALDPADGRAAALLYPVKPGLGVIGGGREAMEQWFVRAMEADPDNIDACRRKLVYLSPQWHGSHTETIAFGRECLGTQNWRADAPLMLIDAHEAASKESGDTKVYFSRPEVWADVRAVFEGHLLNFPADVRRRSAFARFACQCEQWGVARKQFEILKDAVDLEAFGGKAAVDYARRKAERLGGNVGATK